MRFPIVREVLTLYLDSERWDPIRIRLPTRHRE